MQLRLLRGCSRSFDCLRAVIADHWPGYGLLVRLETREIRVRSLPWASSGHVTIMIRLDPSRCPGPQRLLGTWAFDCREWTRTKGGLGCSFSFARAVLIELSS